MDEVERMRAVIRTGKPLDHLYHRLTHVDKDLLIGNCTKCGVEEVSLRSNGKYKCKGYEYDKAPWRRYKLDHCERCGFIPEISAQLEVDHIDGNKENNNYSNLQTLCCNCHRLKTFRNQDWLNKTS
jgi:hypothetical protein